MYSHRPLTSLSAPQRPGPPTPPDPLPLPTSATMAEPKSWIGAVKDEWEMFSDRADDYTIGLPIGFGASSTVYQATFHPRGRIPTEVALKVLDLDRLPQKSLKLLTQETRLMSLSKHPNVLRVRGSWIQGHKLYIALRLMRKGSVADIMKYSFPDGMEEEVIRCILKQALAGLNYLHVNGCIHRDIKSANLLVDDDGTVLLGDLGVAANLDDDESSAAASTADGMKVTNAISKGAAPVARHPPLSRRRGKRKSFVGTPCWMAPEVISQKHYDAKADIWSLGITAIELARGRAPHSRDPPFKVLMKILQEASPTIDRESGAHRYSKAFKEFVDSCLEKDPSKRPTAAELLGLPFFKGAKKAPYLVGTLLNGLPPLAHRQERRRAPSVQSSFHHMESWDFNPTAVGDPLTHRTSGSHGSAPQHGVFGMGDINPAGKEEYRQHLRDNASTDDVHEDNDGYTAEPESDVQIVPEEPIVTDYGVPLSPVPASPLPPPMVPPDVTPFLLQPPAISLDAKLPSDPGSSPRSLNGTSPKSPHLAGPMSESSRASSPTPGTPPPQTAFWKRIGKGGSGKASKRDKVAGVVSNLLERTASRSSSTQGKFK